MKIIHKIIFLLISGSIFSFLFFVTFMTHSLSSFEKPYFENSKIGPFILSKNENIFSLTGVTENNTGTVFVNKLNLFDKVLYTYGNVVVHKAGNETKIDITPGIYYFQLKEFTGKYTISAKGFDIVNKGPGSFIVNTLNSRKNIIFSNETILSIDLKNIATGEKVTKITLYPHQYIIFNPLKNIFVKGSDLLKITQTHTLGFFKDKIENSESFLNFILLRNEKGTTFINTIFEYLTYELSISTKNIKTFSDSTLGTLPGENFIDSYSHLFINKNKQKAYYKNKILRKLKDIITSKKIDLDTNKKMIDLLTTLDKIDHYAYNEMVVVIKFYYINSITASSPINSRINFTSLINEINQTNYSSYPDSLIFLEKIYSDYNSVTYYKDIKNFSYKYFADLGIKLNSDKKNTNTFESEKIKDIEYLLFFLEKIMLNVDINSNIKNITNLINIFNNYIDIANSYYGYSDSMNIKRIGLFTYSKILNKFITIIEATYIKEREHNLLVLKNNTNISKKDLLTLKKNINIIFEYFEQNKSILSNTHSNKDRFLIEKLYPNIEKKYTELFYALNDYEEYLSIYDITKKELLSSNSINENIKKDTSLSIQKAKTYLELFKGIHLNETIIKIMDYSYCLNPSEDKENIEVKTPYCYKVNNIKIDGQDIGFLLFPYLQNKISNITVGNNSKNGTYKLDTIKNELAIKLKSTKTNKERYEFENFLFNTFTKKTDIVQKENKKIETKELTIKEESSVIKTFKRNKLLGKRGDFANITSFIRINYNDLIVTREGTSYKIFIEPSLFNIQLNKDKFFKGYLTSDYDFSNKHSFINPKLQLIENKSNKLLLLGNYIYITGEYSVNSVGEKIKELILLYKQTNIIIDTIAEIINNNNIDILYNKESKIIKFQSNYNDKILLITLSNKTIKSIIYDGKEKLYNDINYISLPTTLNNIIKK